MIETFRAIQPSDRSPKKRNTGKPTDEAVDPARVRMKLAVVGLLEVVNGLQLSDQERRRAWTLALKYAGKPLEARTCPKCNREFECSTGHGHICRVCRLSKKPVTGRQS